MGQLMIRIRISLFFASLMVISSFTGWGTDTALTITIPVIVTDREAVLENSIRLSTDHPALTVESWKASIPAQIIFDPVFKDIPAFTKNFDLITTITNKENKHIEQANVHVTYQISPSKLFVEKFIPLPIASTIQEPKQEEQGIQQSSFIKKTEQKTEKPIIKLTLTTFWEYLAAVAIAVQGLIKKSESIPLQFLAVFLLGIFMSLTPCIYPMIPITAGILQSYGSKSLLHNVLASLAYSLGIATTFACFGYIAASTGKLFGNLLGNPFFILFIVFFLGYMGLTMLDVVQFYTPKFMQTKKVKRGKFFLASAFFFGVVSGSVTSPCLTPGLAFMLTLVATMGNKILGFLLLFTAGIGLSLPLLVVGAFSSSLNALPKAGIWMVEIKKLFAFILFGMCFFFLKNILPSIAWLIAVAAFLFITGFYFFKSIKPTTTRGWRFFKNIIGVSTIMTAMLVASKALQEYYYPTQEIEALQWQTSYENAQELARKEQKKLFIDIGADFCSICKAIDKQVFGDSSVQATLHNFVLLKINASEQQELYNQLKDRYTILGVPTILVIDPITGKQLGRWGGELYRKATGEFINELNGLI